jgi:hypothetical protein
MCCSLVGVSGEAIAQTSSASSTEQLAFDRPEAWVFQTNAQTYGQPDHTRLHANGVTLMASAGIGFTVTERVTIVADLFYAPLTDRRTASSASSIDPTINARALISYRVIR